MRVFKTTYKDRKGRTKQAAAWYVEFKDHLDTPRRLPAFTSKAASEELGRNLEKLVAYHKASGGQTDPALTRFLAGLPPGLGSGWSPSGCWRRIASPSPSRWPTIWPTSPRR